jgi:hypothetical protein
MCALSPGLAHKAPILPVQVSSSSPIQGSARASKQKRVRIMNQVTSLFASSVSHYISRALLAGFVVVMASLAASSAQANCDCGSGDQSAACTGQSVSISEGTADIGFSFQCEGGDCYCGKFTNQHDYWVAPKTPGGEVTLTAMTPARTGSGSSMRHGHQVDPSDPGCWSLDGRIMYDSSCDPGSLPITVDTSTSGFKPQVWLKAQSLLGTGGDCTSKDSDGNYRMCTRLVAPLTVLDRVPPDAGTTVFRPPYFGRDNKPMISTAELDTSFLPELPDVPRNGESQLVGWDSALRHTKHVKPDWGAESTRSERMHPKAAYDTLNGYNARAFRWLNPSIGMLVVEASGAQDAAKKQLLARHVAQYGLDLYHISKYGKGGSKGHPDCGAWLPNGGHSQGRYGPIVLAAHLLQKQAWLDHLVDLNSTVDKRQCFSETGQIQVANPNGANIPLYGCLDGVGKTWDASSKNSCAADPDGMIDLAGVSGGSMCPGGYMTISWTNWRYEGSYLMLIPQVVENFPAPHFLEYVKRMFKDGPRCSPGMTGQYATVSRCNGGSDNGKVCHGSDSECGGGGDCVKASGTFRNGAYDDFGLQIMYDQYAACSTNSSCENMSSPLSPPLPPVLLP